MVTEHDFSNQDELIESLDPDPVFDYLLQHGVMDKASVDEIRAVEVRVQRNRALLKHLEGTGSAAVALFINALRQSGQLHLASSLDVEQRIKPVYGQGYWEKQRYKGQVTIMYQLVAAKVLVRKDSEEDRTAYITDQDVMLTPHKLKRSYENMIAIPLDEHEGPKARKILEYSYEEEEEKKSSWCQCLPFFCCSSKSRKKKKQKERMDVSNANIYSGGALIQSEISLNICDNMVSLPEQPSSPLKSGSTYFKSRPSSPSKTVKSESQTFSRKSDSLDRNSNHQLGEIVPSDVSNLSEMLHTEVVYDPKSGEVTVATQSDKQKKKKKTKSDKKKSKVATDIVEINNSKNEPANRLNDKENNAPCILSLSKEQSPQGSDSGTSTPSPTKTKRKQEPRSPSSMKRSATYELVERWKSEGQVFERVRDQFCSFLDSAIQGKIVRYFEQERRTLLLQVEVNDLFSVSTLCMTGQQVNTLRDDYEKGILHENLVKLVMPQNIIDKMDCCAIHLRTVIDENDFALALQELS